MTPQPPPLDIVTVSVAVFSFAFGPSGVVLGAYAVIVLSALGGAAWSSASRAVSTRWATLQHVAFCVGLALLLTVPLAGWLQAHAGLEMRWTLGPIAALIAAKPDWVLRRIADAWNAFSRNKTGKEGSEQ